MPVLPNIRHELYAQRRAAGMTALEAYVAAGYAPTKANACKLGREPQVRARIEELLTDGAARAGVSAELVLREIACIAFANVADFAVLTQDDPPQFALRDIPREKLAALSEIATETVTTRDKTQTVRRVKLKLWDKRAALLDLARYFNLFADKNAPQAGDDAVVILPPNARD